jgi:hypothetical protein
VIQLVANVRHLADDPLLVLDGGLDPVGPSSQPPSAPDDGFVRSARASSWASIAARLETEFVIVPPSLSAVRS